MKLSLKRILKESEQEPKDLDEKEFWEDWKVFKDKVDTLKTKIFRYDSIIDKYSSDGRSVTYSEIYQKLHDEKGLKSLQKEIHHLTQEMANMLGPGFKSFDIDQYNDLINIKSHKKNEYAAQAAQIRFEAGKIQDEFENVRDEIFQILNRSFNTTNFNPADLLNKYLDHVDDYDTAYEMATILLNAISLMDSTLNISFSSLAKPIGRFLDDNF